MKSSHRMAIVLAALALLFSPIWARHFQTIKGHSLLLNPDSLISLSLTFFTGLFAERLVPNSVINLVNRFSCFVKTHSVWIFVIFLSLLLAGLYLTNQHVLQAFMNSGDEHSCHFLAECIRNGRWWATPHPLSEFFEVVHVGNRDGKWFSVYPPGWPLLFAIGLELNIRDWMNPLLAIFSTFFLFQTGKKVFGLPAASLGIFFLCMSPFFVFNNASYFSHTTALFSISLFLYAHLRWMEQEENLFWALLAALAIGYGIGTRYLTMAAIAAPFLLFRLFRLILKREQWTKAHFLFVLTLSLMFFLNLYLNFLITGNFFIAPNHYHHRWERLGFHDNYTLLDALSMLVARFFFLLDWIPPAFVLLYVVSLIQKNRSGDANMLLFRYGFFYLVIAFIFYYSWGGNQYGPRYYFEGLPFLMLGVGEVIWHWWRAGNPSWQKFLLGIVTASLVGNIYLFVKQSQFYEVASRQRKALYELAEATAKKPAIVFIRGFLGDKLVMAEEDAVRNHPNLNTPILYAHDLGEKNKLLIDFYPDRTYYLGFYDRSVKEARLEVLKR